MKIPAVPLHLAVAISKHFDKIIIFNKYILLNSILPLIFSLKPKNFFPE